MIERGLRQNGGPLTSESNGPWECHLQEHGGVLVGSVKKVKVLRVESVIYYSSDFFHRIGNASKTLLTCSPTHTDMGRGGNRVLTVPTSVLYVSVRHAPDASGVVGRVRRT